MTTLPRCFQLTFFIKLIAIFLFSLSGCVYQGSLGEVSCDDDADCLAGASCVQGFCVHQGSPGAPDDPDADLDSGLLDADPGANNDAQDSVDDIDDGSDPNDDLCPPGLTNCSGQCVDLTTDEHCGKCDRQCIDGFTCNGNDCGCTGTDKKVCNGKCVSIKTRENCGDCAVTCTDDQLCTDSGCEADCPIGEAACDGQCVDTTSDQYCGGCPGEGGVDCTAQNKVCSFDAHNQAYTCECAENHDLCGGDTCIDLSSSEDHCGTCGTECLPDQTCSNGSCEFDCKTNETVCSDQCVDLDTDPQNCGSCENRCAIGQACSAGQCRCPENHDLCGGDTCIDLTSSKDHCGGCGEEFRCIGNSTCEDEKCVCNPQGHPFGGGDGTSADTAFLICSAEQLDRVRGYLNAHFKLADHIDLSPFPNFEPIGTNANNSNRFRGTFDGAHYTIKNLTVHNPTADHQGLFGIQESGTIKNFTLENVSVRGAVNVGAVVGESRHAPNRVRSTVKNVQVINATISGKNNVGGLVGYNIGDIERSGTSGTSDPDTPDVSGARRVGGLVGLNGNEDAGYGKISQSRADMTVDASNNDVGGLVGKNQGYIDDSYALGDVSGNEVVGGLVGYHERFSGGSGQRRIRNSYAYGKASGNARIGGLVGARNNRNPQITASYYLQRPPCSSSSEESVGCANYGNNNLGTSLPVIDFRDETKFINWDFNGPLEIWKMDPDFDFPILRWE